MKKENLLFESALIAAKKLQETEIPGVSVPEYDDLFRMLNFCFSMTLNEDRKTELREMNREFLDEHRRPAEVAINAMFDAGFPDTLARKPVKDIGDDPKLMTVGGLFSTCRTRKPECHEEVAEKSARQRPSRH